MKTRLVEVTNRNQNWGKFLLGVFDQDELAVASAIDQRPLVWGRGWGPGHILVLDLQTGEGAVFKLGGSARADLAKHQIWVCPLYEPFLEWLYVQEDPMNVPALVDLPDAPFAFAGYRRSGSSLCEPPQCEGDHYFEEVCQRCGAAKPGGPCAVCPHIGPTSAASAEHFARRPCLKCGSADLRSVRVRPSISM